MLTVSQLYVYPVKSLAGIAVDRAEVTDRGFAHDRRYMLVTPDNVFITLRRFPKMALLHPRLEAGTLSIHNTMVPGRPLVIQPPPADRIADRQVVIWNATVAAQHVSGAADRWFSDAMGTDCHLVYMPDGSRRPVDTTSGYHPAGKFTSFADAYPFLLIGEASLADLNARYAGDDELSMARFRPNIVCAGGEPYAEDTIGDFRINDISFTGLEKCARCNIPNVDPLTGKKSKDREPFKTLMGYRSEGRAVNFGMNLVHAGTGSIRIGDQLAPDH